MEELKQGGGWAMGPDGRKHQAVQIVGCDPVLLVWIVEYGAVSLPMGGPSRLTCFEVHESMEAAQKAMDDMEFDARLFAVPVPPPLPKEPA